MIKALIFDLDGLLADTESIHYEAYRVVLEKHGIAISKHDFIDHWTNNGLGIKEYLKNNGETMSPEILREEKALEFAAILQSELTPMKGASALLARCFGSYFMALATSSHEKSAQFVVKTLGFERYFSVFITRSDVRFSKPNPEIFLRAARMLSISPSECLVLEDSVKGVRAGVAAGMKVIAIPNQYTQGSDFTNATTVLDSLDKVTDQLLISL